MRYSIEGQELTDIADALRRRYGETEWVVADGDPTVLVSKSKGSTGFDEYGGQFATGETIDTFHIDGASSIKVKVSSKFYTGHQKLFIAPGLYTLKNMPTTSDYNFTGQTTEVIFNSTNSVSIKYNDEWKWEGNFGYYAEIYGFDVNGNELKEIKKTYQSSEMAQAIDNILPVPNEEAFFLTGDCTCRFAYNGWNWFIDIYGDLVKTENISCATDMFLNSTQLREIPFEINFGSSQNYHDLKSMFEECNSLTYIPKINNCKPRNMDSIFSYCDNLRELPKDIEDWFDWSYMEQQTSASSCSRSRMFYQCISLRKIPSGFLNHAVANNSNSYSYFHYGFTRCYVLDELIDLPIPYVATWTTNAFSSAFTNCGRLKNLTFAMPNGQPYVVNWKNQTIDLTVITTPSSYILNYNSGITADKEVTDDATYQALKNDPDWWSGSIAYARYNHDSAIETINSLPDTSAYLASSGGTNTIKFNGAAGELTDGGAINTLTEEEIAVATAKGWTVTFA